MYVNQLAFLLLVLASVIVYYLMPKKWQWGFLLCISLIFYRLMGVKNFLYVIITSVSLTLTTLKMQSLDERLALALKAEGASFTRQEKKEKKEAVKAQKRKWLIAAIFLNLGILLVLKYGDFFLGNVNSVLGIFGFGIKNQLGLIAPLGISYYTLQAIGYALEVFKGKSKAEKNPFKVLLYVTYYPQMTQGPIGRFSEMAPQLFTGHEFAYDNIAIGCQRILWGLFKKAVIGDNLKPLVTAIFGGYETVSGFTLLMGCIYMTLQLYADFSGYSDIVCGISQLYGIRLMENFKRPFISMSLGEYWRKWHISLSSWFRDFVFYPASLSKGAVRFTRMGKNMPPRVKKVLPVVYAMSLVWLGTGFWHDASWRYIFWGIGNGAVLIISVILEPQFTWVKEKLHIKEDAWWWKAFCILRTFMIVAILKVFPGAADTTQSIAIIKQMLFHFSPKLDWASLFMDTKWFRLVFVAAGLLLFLIVSIIQEKHGSVRAFLADKPFVLRWALYLMVLGMLVYMGNFDTMMTGGFEYAQF